jgi:predicted HD superfamily hydrolase involved in NAD metabolism
MNTSRATDSTSLDALIPVVERYLKQTLSRKRFKHTVRVGRLCRDICGRYGLDPEAGYFVGMAHDLAREWRNEDLVELSSHDAQPFSALEAERPLLLHGRAAALFLSERLGVTDGEVIDAVRHHTFGRPGFCALGKALFLADYLEPGRKYIDSEFRRKVLARPLDEAVRAIIDHAVSRGKSLAEPTRAMYDEIATES